MISRRNFIVAASGVAIAGASGVAIPAAPGRRVSVESGDPGEVELALIRADGHEVEIYLDGVIQEHALTADEAEGMVKRYMTSAGGEILINREAGRILEETVRGLVEVRIV